MNFNTKIKLHTLNLKMAANYFFQCKIQLIFYALFSVGLFVWLTYIGFAAPGIWTLSFVCQLQFYIQVFIVITSYEYFKRFTDRALDEGFSSATEGRPVYSIYLLIWQIITALVFQMLIIIAVMLSSLLDGHQAYFLSWMWKPILINQLLPTVISVLLAYTLSFRVKRLASYGMILVFLIMISPYAEMLVWNKKPEGFPIDQLVNLLKWPFTILYQNANWEPDLQYGLQTELPRILVQLFWIVLLLGLSPLIKTLRINRKSKYIAMIISTVVAGVILAASFQPASLYRINQSWDGTRIDLDYYGYYDQGKRREFDLKIMQKPDFKIDEYQLDVNLNNDLDVNATLTIQAEKPTNNFILTLYHGYRVTNARIENGEDVLFTQDGDLLTLILPKPEQSARISLKYSGFSKKFYSNSEGAMLPGYFPWYHMAGIRQIIIRPSSGGYGYNPYNRVEEADFRLTVKNTSHVATNLNFAGNNSYIGRSDGLSLFAGNILMSDDHQIKTRLPLAYFKNNTEEQVLAFYQSTLADIYQSIDGIVTNDLSITAKKPVIAVSFDLYRNYLIGGYAEFSDYILIAEGAFSEDTIIKYYNGILETRKDSLLCEILIRTISGTAEQTFSNIFNYFQFLEAEKANIVKQGKDSAEIDRTLAFLEPLTAAIEKQGEQAVFEKLSSYLTDLRTPTNDLEFLQSLLKGD